MKKENLDQVNEVAFSPESAFKQMSVILTQIQSIDGGDKKASEAQKQALNKEIYKLSKTTKEYFKKAIVKTRKKPKVINKTKRSKQAEHSKI